MATPLSTRQKVTQLLRRPAKLMRRIVVEHVRRKRVKRVVSVARVRQKAATRSSVTAVVEMLLFLLSGRGFKDCVAGYGSGAPGRKFFEDIAATPD